MSHAHLSQSSERGGSGHAVIYNPNLPEATLHRMTAETWRCSCGHVESDGDPEVLREKARKHYETCGGVK